VSIEGGWREGKKGGEAVERLAEPMNEGGHSLPPGHDIINVGSTGQFFCPSKKKMSLEDGQERGM